MKSINKFIAVTVLCLPFGMISCNKGDETTYSGTAVLSIQDAQVNPEVKELLPPQTVSYDLRVVSEIVPDNTLSVAIKVNPDGVSAFNAKHGTDYQLLMADCYEISGKEVLLPKYNKISSTINLVVNSENLGEDKTYILPLAIGDVKGSENWTKAEVGTETYIVVKKKILPPVEIIDRSKWNIVYCSSETEESNSGIRTGLSKDLIDGKPETYWSYNYNNPDEATKYAPFYIVFDMGQEISVRGANLLARQKTLGDLDSDPWLSPKRIRIDLAESLTDALGMNDSDYIYSETISLPWQMKSEIYLEKIHRVRYLRFVYVVGWNNWNMNADYLGGSLAEFDVLGNYEDILK